MDGEMDELKGVPGPKQVARSARRRSCCDSGDSWCGMSRVALSQAENELVPKERHGEMEAADSE